MIGGPFDHCHDLAAKPDAACSHPRSYYHCASNCCPDCGHKWGGPDESRLRREGMLPKPAESDADEADRCPAEERMRGWSHKEYISHVRHVWDLIAALRRENEALKCERDTEKEAATTLAADLEQSRNDFVACSKDFTEAIRRRNAAQAEVERQKEINGRASDAGRCIIAERDKAQAELAAVKAELQGELAQERGSQSTLDAARETNAVLRRHVGGEHQLRAALAAMTERAEKAESDAAGRARFEQWYRETMEERDQKTEECGYYLGETKRLAGELLVARADANALAKALREAVAAFHAYQMDAECAPTAKHRDMIHRIDAALAAHDARRAGT